MKTVKYRDEDSLLDLIEEYSNHKYNGSIPIDILTGMGGLYKLHHEIQNDPSISLDEITKINYRGDRHINGGFKIHHLPSFDNSLLENRTHKVLPITSYIVIGMIGPETLFTLEIDYKNL